MIDFSAISVNVLVLILRLVVVVLLYTFLWQVLRTITSDLRRGVTPIVEESSPYGQLILVSAGQTGLSVGKSFPLQPVTSIGRSLDSDIALNDGFMSADHARLELRDEGWVLHDLGSTNGTFVNGFEVKSATIVYNGDIVRVGRVELRMVL